jgi:signal transduction histidine kinase
MSELIDKEIRKVLVIDDNQDIHNDFKKILEMSEELNIIDEMAAEYFGQDTRKQIPQNHYELQFAFQGYIGMEMIKKARDEKNPFMLAFVDMRMPPGWDGLQTIERIWRVDPDVQVVICTAYSDYSWEEITRRIGRTDKLLMLKKPFDSSEVEQIASALTEKWLLARKSELKNCEMEKMVQERTRELAKTNMLLKKEIVERKRAEKNIKILAREVILVQEKERKRIACDLHDSVAQDLASLLLVSETLFDDEENVSEKVKNKIDNAFGVLKNSINSVRNISYNLRPPSLTEFGISHAISHHLGNAFDESVETDFSSAGIENIELDFTTEINIYRIVQEALTNIKKYARATKVMVRLIASSPNILLKIEDNGVGFNADLELGKTIDATKMGLKGIEERVSMMNGKVSIKSVVSKGTRIAVEIPCGTVMKRNMKEKKN